MTLNERNVGDGLEMLSGLTDGAAAAAFFDPQYRGVLDKLAYGNEGDRRGQERARLKQMDDTLIWRFLTEIARVLRPSGHLFLWTDKFHLVEGVGGWLADTDLEHVDLITWDKARIGMGYRTRRVAEYLLVLQKPPRKAKGVWTDHALADVWTEEIHGRRRHAHQKPQGLQRRLIEACTQRNDLVIDPAAGSFSVLYSARAAGRHFLGTDLEPTGELF